MRSFGNILKETVGEQLDCILMFKVGSAGQS